MVIGFKEHKKDDTIMRWRLLLILNIAVVAAGYGFSYAIAIDADHILKPWQFVDGTFFLFGQDVTRGVNIFFVLVATIPLSLFLTRCQASLQLRGLSVPVNTAKPKVERKGARLICDECGWIGYEGELLSAPNPFEPGDLYACPQCKSLEGMYGACEVDGCKQKATCGTPAANGYVCCCGEHYRELTREAN